MSQPYEEIEWDRNPEGEKLDILREQAGFVQDVADLIAILPGTMQPENQSHSFTFAVLPFSTPFEFPQILKPLANTIDDFSVQLGDPRIAESSTETSTPAYLSIDFNVGDDVYTLSRSGQSDAADFTLHKLDTKNYRHSELTPQFETRLSEVGRVSQAELNALLMSIALPSPTGDYEAYADKELQSAEAYESLCELLASKAIDQTDVYYFMLNDEETDLHFVKENGQTASFTLSYYDRKRNLPLLVEYDIGSEFTLRFFSVEGAGKTPVMPTGEEVNYVRRLLKSELSTTAPQLFAVEKGELIEPASQAPDREHQLSNEASALVDIALNELGLNPPNTSA